jgi:hypothetical protein
MRRALLLRRALLIRLRSDTIEAYEKNHRIVVRDDEVMAIIVILCERYVRWG